MIPFEAFKQLALSLPQVTEEPHFEKTSFRVNKKIFATYDSSVNRATVKLSAIDQDVFVVAGKQAIYAVDNKWGKQGWTIIELSFVHPDLCADALTTAYCSVAPKPLATLVRP